MPLNNITNIWEEKILLYVLSGYWQEGYVLDSENQWTEQSESSNTWVVIG